MTDKDKDQAPKEPKMKEKAILIKAAPLMALLKLEWEGGGEIPPELSGVYTSSKSATEAAKAHFAAKGFEVEVVNTLLSKGKTETRREAKTVRELSPI